MELTSQQPGEQDAGAVDFAPEENINPARGKQPGIGTIARQAA